MSYYPGRVQDYFLNPRNVGEVAADDGVVTTADTGSFVCGAALRLSMLIDRERLEVKEARFKAAGCGYLIAAASVLTEMLRGMSISEAVGQTENCALNERIAAALEGVPSERAHCIALCCEALGAALDDYHETVRQEWQGEEALICTCFGVSEKTIEEMIAARSLRTIEQVTRACNAGGGCHSCHPLIEDILEDYWRTEGLQ